MGCIVGDWFIWMALDGVTSDEFIGYLLSLALEWSLIPLAYEMFDGLRS